MYCFTRIFVACCSALALFLIHSSCHACRDLFVLSNNSHFGVVHRIEAVLNAKDPNTHVSHLIIENTTPQAIIDKANQACMVVGIGAEALTQLMQKPVTTPTLFILVRKNFYDKQTQRYTNAAHNRNRPISAIYLDQPILRQIYLIQALFHEKPPKRIGILHGHDAMIADEMNALKQTPFTLIPMRVNRMENPVAVFNALMDESDIVLGLPDPLIYNPKTARGILLSAFRKHKPFVGFSRTFVNNGALCAVYSNTKQIGEEVTEIILKQRKKSPMTLPKPRYPKQFTVAVNYQVAQSLGLQPEKEAQLTHIIQAMEEKNGQ